MSDIESMLLFGAIGFVVGFLLMMYITMKD